MYYHTIVQRVKNGCTNKIKQSAFEINADLLMYYTDMQNAFKEFEVQDIVPTNEQIKEALSKLTDYVNHLRTKKNLRNIGHLQAIQL